MEEFEKCLSVIEMEDRIKKEIVDAVEEYNEDEIERMFYDEEEDKRMIQNDELIIARREGIKEEKISIAKKMIADNISFEDISKYTSLSIQEIENIIN